MTMMRIVLIVALLVPGVALAQTAPPADVWKEMATRAGAGSDVQVRLADGAGFRATLVRVDDAGVMLQPKTRVPVPVQAVPYEAIASLELATKGGVSVGKAVAIGVGTGVAAFWGMAILAFALIGD